MAKIPKKVKQIQEHKKAKVDYDTQNSFSYSQISTFLTCPHRWYLDKIAGLQEYEPNIHTVFGTAVHETIQKWLGVLYDKTVKEALEMNLDDLLLERMKKTYKKERYRNGHVDFTNSEEMTEFFEQGAAIMEYLKKKRADYFFKQKVYLAGVEVPLVKEVKKNLFFKGYIDLVFYDENIDRYTLVDIKTSTRGWTDWHKKDEIKQLQLVLYKHYFCETFDIDPSKVDVQFFIVKRILPQNTDFPVKRVQLFEPASGKIKTGKAIKMLNKFVAEAFDDNGQYIQKEYDKKPSKNNCRFCPYKEQLSLCDSGIF